MASKAQRRKERHEKKRKEKQKKRKEQMQSGGVSVPSLTPPPSDQQHRERLARQQPRAWAGEPPEDVAMFDDAVLATLPTELAEQVQLVREALEATTQSRGEAALQSLSVISRSSPLSEWRLFIRGLVDWLADQTESAAEAWKRLDPERRPGRIASSLLLSSHPDLKQLSLDDQQENVSSPVSPLPCDDQLLQHAKLLHRVRIDRVALQIAEKELRKPEEDPELLLGPQKIRWLKKFIREYRETEPELTREIEQAALLRAFSQAFLDLFEMAIESFTGPRHDPRNLLLSFHFYRRFDDAHYADKKADGALNKYLKQDLPANENLTEELRGAIASQVYLLEANSLIKGDQNEGLMGFFAHMEYEDVPAIRANFKRSLEAYPGNVKAYKAYADWIQSRLDEDDMTQAKRKPWEQELLGVMRGWSENQPDAVPPRLWLVDYLLENEQMVEAQPHVEFLVGARHDAPLVRATPWKWHLLEAMRLCRRKNWLDQVPAQLDQAEALWPGWLSRQWLPYLRAAYKLRAGQKEAFESDREQICETFGWARNSLPDACMMLGAAQRMRIPTSELKQFREPVDQAVKNRDKIPVDEFIDAAGFFWDLSRTQMLYPAYRMHASKLGRTLIQKLAKNLEIAGQGMDEERIHKMVFWCSEYRFWDTGHYHDMPSCFYIPFAKKRHPMFAAAHLNSFLKMSRYWSYHHYEESSNRLRKAVASQRDPYYRHWFQSMLDQYDDLVADYEGPSGRFPFF